MRFALLALVAALVLAGCATNDSPGTSTSTPPTTTTPSGSGNGTMTMTEIVTDSHDFTTDAAAGTPVGGATSKAFVIPDGYTMANLTVRFSPVGVGPGGVAAGISVKSAGLTCALPDGPITSVVGCTKEGAATPGDAKIEYAGSGPVTASVVVSGG